MLVIEALCLVCLASCLVCLCLPRGFRKLSRPCNPPTPPLFPTLGYYPGRPASPLSCPYRPCPATLRLQLAINTSAATATEACTTSAPGPVLRLIARPQGGCILQLEQGQLLQYEAGGRLEPSLAGSFPAGCPRMDPTPASAAGALGEQQTSRSLLCLWVWVGVYAVWRWYWWGDR